MANEIDLIVGKEAIAGLDALIAKLTIADELLVKTANDALSVGKNLPKVTTPSGYNNNTNTNKNLEKDVLATQKALQLQTKAWQDLNKQREKGLELQAKEANSYNKVQTALNKLSVSYKDLATRKALGEQLSAKEEARYSRLGTLINKYDSALKTVDATMGKHNRNVGNYTGQFNALGNSINQLSREMPAFANSAQTGFMAISNNIPAFTDAIGQLKQANKDLVASGQAPVSIMEQLGSALFSMNSLISVGVTLLTVYGAKLVEWAFNTDAVKEANEKLNETIKKQTELLEDNIEAIKYQARVDAALSKLKGKTDKEIAEIGKQSNRDVVTETEKEYNLATKELQVFQDNKRKIEQNAGAFYLALIKKNNGDRTKASKEYERYAAYLTDENGKILLKNTTDLYDKLKNANDEMVASSIEADVSLLEKTKKAKEEKIDLNYDETDSVIDLTEALKELKKAQEDINYIRGFDQNALDVKNGQDVTDNGSTGTEGVSNDALFGYTPNIFPDEDNVDKWKDDFDQIAELAQDFNNLIADLNQARFDQQYALLEQQKETALKFAGESEEARIKIEEDYEKRRSKLQRKQAEAAKKQAIFDMTINIAQSVVKTLGQSGFAGIPLSLIVGALGAAQLAVAIATPLPEYFKGTDNAEGGLAWTQEKGAEVITDKHGNIKTLGSNKGAQLTRLSQGDKVYTAEESKQMLFENEYNKMLNINGIKPANSGISADEMRSVLSDTLGAMPKQNVSFDNNGFSSYLIKGGSKTKRTENRASGFGLKF